MSVSFFSGLREKITGRRKSLLELKADIIDRRAKGKTVSDGEVEAVVNGGVATLDELDNLVAERVRRNAAAEQLGQRDQLIAERKELAIERQSLETESEEVARNYQRQLREIDVRLLSLNHRITTLEGVKAELVATAPDDLQESRRAILAKRAERLRHRELCRTALAECEARTANCEQELRNASPRDKQSCEQQLAAAQRAVASAEQRLTDSVAAVERLDAELAELKLQMAAA